MLCTCVGTDGAVLSVPVCSGGGHWVSVPRTRRFLLLDNDTEYFVEPRHHHISMARGGSGGALSMYVRGGGSRGGGASVARAGSVGSAAEAEWQIPPEDILICKDPYGRDWQLGTGGFGSVRCEGRSISVILSLLKHP